MLTMIAPREDSPQRHKGHKGLTKKTGTPFPNEGRAWGYLMIGLLCEVFVSFVPLW
jgi:hypothetical protein